MKLEYTVTNSDLGNTIHTILLQNYHFSTRLFSKLIKQKNIYCNNTICDTRSMASLGDIISIVLGIKEDNSNTVPTKMNLSIVYEDDWFLVVNKPAGIAIHPSHLHYDTSLSNGVCYYFHKIGLHKKIRPVNRLDIFTSGLVIFAKCEYIQECFSRQMSSGDFQKEYLCFITGSLSEKKGTISLPIGRKEGSIIERCVCENGQPSITHYEVLQEFPFYSLVKCSLETGRTHQIRVHMKEIGHPLVGDTLYGDSSSFIVRQALHSSHIRLIHPITQQTMDFEIPLPNDMQQLFQLGI